MIKEKLNIKGLEWLAELYSVPTEEMVNMLVDEKYDALALANKKLNYLIQSEKNTILSAVKPQLAITEPLEPLQDVTK